MSEKKAAMQLNFNLGGARELKKLPFRMVVLGNFSAGSGRRCGEAPLRVTKDSYNDVLDTMGTHLVLEVENLVRAQPGPLAVSFHVTDISDLTPAGIIANVPELTAIFLFKERLLSLINRTLSADEFVSGLGAYASFPALAPALRRCRAALDRVSQPARVETSATPQTAAKPSDRSIDRILDMIATPGLPASNTPPRGIDDVLSSIGSERAIGAPPPELTEVVNEIRLLLDRQITLILHHPQFRTVEAAWRNVQLLLGQMRNADVELELIDVTRENLADAFRSQVLNAEATDASRAPLGMVLLDFAFGFSTHDVATLQTLGETALQLQAPIVFSVAQDFFGAMPDDTHALPYPGTVLGRPQYAAWNALREKECARWLCGAYNRLLLRAQYTRDNSHGLDFTEGSSGSDQPLWGNPGGLVAALILRSMATTQWPTQITGMRHGQLSGLELHTYTYQGRNDATIPLNALLTIQNAEDLATFGIAPLSCQPDRDSAYLLYAPTLRVPESYPGKPAQRDDFTSLPYQLFAGRVTAALRAHQELFTSGASTEESAALVRQLLQSVVADTGPGHRASVSVQADADQTARRLLAIEVHTGQDILNGATLRLILLC